MNTTGLVIIGRNEGDRLRQCLVSAIKQLDPSQMVYVDSGSTDKSVDLARSLGLQVVELDMTIPFTAARARNEGFTLLKGLNPQLDYVQFVDGDCEIVENWLGKAEQFLTENPSFAVVCGRRRERFPEKTLYNYLCDLEWNTPIGEANACGGDSMMRVKALEQVGGFNPNLIAGEEPELCQRLRKKSWKIYRLDAEMTLHDADMTRFSQWWKRTMRSGYAFASFAALHRDVPKLFERKQGFNIWLWAFIVPAIALLGIWPTHGWSLGLFTGYGLMTFKIYQNQRRRSFSVSNSFTYAFFCMLGRFPQLQGQISYYWNTWQGKTSSLIEYKLNPDS